MKRSYGYLAAIIAALALSGCYNPVGSESEVSGSQSTPSDQTSYVERATSTQFSFETVFDTAFEVVVRGEGDGGAHRPPLSGAFVRLETESGHALFEGTTGAEGAVHGTVSLPAVPQNIDIQVSTAGYGTRTVTVERMVEYAEVSRVMYLERGGILTQVYGNADSDGDGVPDVYDAFPDDPNAAFAVDYPSEGTYTVAFEDLYGRARAGDADYNDFVGQYSITEITDGEGRITRIRGTAHSHAKLAGYNHQFGLYFRFNGNARMAVVRNDNAAPALNEMRGRPVTDGAEVILFPSTQGSVGRTAEFMLDFSDNPQDPDEITGAPYDPYLYVKNTGADVHLIGREPLPDSNNPEDDEFRDADGFPWALLVPADWEHPDEGQRIEEAYPAFDYWRTSEGEHYPDWYLMPGVDPGPPSEENQPPYPVVGGIPDDEPEKEGVQADLFYVTAETFTLEIDEDNEGRLDPDGDAVRFASDPVLDASNDELDYLTLDPETGVVEFRPDGSVREVTIRFYTVDEHGNSSEDEAFVVDFVIGAS